MQPTQPDWTRIDTVLLDMDGTVLDLAYDNWFWSQHIPEQVAAKHGCAVADIAGDLDRAFAAVFGTLDWYCLDYWTRTLALDIAALKQASAHAIRPLDGALDAVAAMRDHADALWLVTNAHPETLRIKLERADLAPLFDRLISSHSFRAPKESPAFWQRLAQAHPHTAERSLFVDDSLRVREAARAAGYAQVWGVAQPDSGRAPTPLEDGPYVRAINELLPTHARERAVSG